MKRFIDLKDQTGNVDYESGEREFAFYCTVTDSFHRFSGSETWSSKEEFIEDCKDDGLSEDFIQRFVNLIPDDYFEKQENLSDDPVVQDYLNYGGVSELTKEVVVFLCFVFVVLMVVLSIAANN